MSLTRRKSMRPIDRAPKVVNRPSTCPIHLMSHPDTTKLSKTTGEGARQFSSFSPDGLFPDTLDANKAPRGSNDIDKQLMAERRKVVRAQSAKLRDREHRELELELNRVVRLPLADFLKHPPTTDPHHLFLSSTVVSSRTEGAVSPVAAEHQMSPSHQQGNWNASMISSVSNFGDFVAEGHVAAPTRMLMRPASGGGASSQRPASAASSLYGGGGAPPPTPSASTVPTTTLGSRPTTPSVYIGGRVNVDCSATLSRPTSAAMEPFTAAVTASSNVGGLPPAGSSSGGPPRLASVRHGSRVALHGTSAFASSVGGESQTTTTGHLRLMVLGRGGTTTGSDDVQEASSASTATLLLGNAEASKADTPNAVISRPASVAAATMSTTSSWMAKHASSPSPQRHAVVYPSSSDTSWLMASSPFSNLLQRPTSAAMGGSAAAAQRVLHQRHQTQHRRQHGFNVSTSFISHEPSDPFEVGLNEILRTRPSSAAAAAVDRRPGTGVARTSAPLVYPLRTVFLQ
jgi:hypothetical protein